MISDSGQLLADYVAGKGDAATEIFNRYVARLTALAASRLSEKLRTRVDPEDIVQSTMRSFFRKADLAEVAHERNGDLWRLLAAITIHKVLQRVEYERAQKRDLGREQRGELPLDVLEQTPSHEDIVMLIDQLESYMQGLRIEDCRVFKARLDGESVATIAIQENMSEAKVRLKLDGLKRRLQRRLNSE